MSVKNFKNIRLKLLNLGESRPMSKAGVAQLVELQPSKLNVASSSLVSRSKLVSVQK